MANKKLNIAGKITNNEKLPLPNLRIEAWDKDLLFGDFVGKAITDTNGYFQIRFTLKRFKKIFFDKRPDLYFKIYADNKIIHSTENSVLWNIESDQKDIEIVVDFGVTVEHTPLSVVADVPDGFSVSGLVFQNDKPLYNSIVQAFDQDLPSKKIPRSPLGEPVFTDREGRFLISYQEAQFKRAENESADVVLTISDKKGELLHTTDVYFNAPSDLSLSIRFTRATEPSKYPEYDQYVLEIDELLDGELAVAQLTAADFSFLSKETEIQSGHLQLMHFSNVMSGEAGIRPVFFYGLLRQFYPANLSAWAAFKKSEILEAIKKSVHQNIIAEYAEIESDIEKIVGIALQKAFSTPLQNESYQTKATIGDVLKTVLPDENTQLKFLALYHQFEGDRSEFWTKLKDDPDFGKHAGQLAFNLQVFQLSYQNLNFIQALKTHARLSKMEDLVQMETADWQNFIQEQRIEIPKHIFGADENKRAFNYAQSISAVLETNFPNAFVAKIIRNQPEIHPEVFSFFEKDDIGFDITKTPVEQYLKSETGIAVLEKIQDKQKTVAQLKYIQRLYNITGESKLMGTFMQQGIQSAHQIANMSINQYVQVMNGSGVEIQTLLATHARATQITKTNTLAVKELHAYYTQVLPQVVGTQRSEAAALSTAIIDIPDYKTLFGPLDSCDCGHCRSVYSATAYFVELMHELLGGKFWRTNATLSNPFTQLLFRRPDLQFIKLTCENTETEIPYIDVVNEILETYIGMGALDESHTRDTSNFTAEELAANPQYIVDEAHTKLTDAVFPLNMPFNIHLETGREYFTYLGSSRSELLNTFLPKETIAQQNTCYAENILLSEKEYEILTQAGFNENAATTPPHLLYGYDNNDQPLGHDDRVKIAARFLEKISITYDDLLAILQTTAINPLWPIADYLQDPTIADIPKEQVKREAFIAKNGLLLAQIESSVIVLSATLDHACNLSQTSIVYKNNTALSDADFGKINRFVRLWKKLEISIQETDLLLTAFAANGNIKAETIKRMSTALALNKILNLPIEKLVCLWKNIPMVGKKSLFQTMFLNKAALKIDDKYGINQQQDELAELTHPINDHVPALLAAFKVSEQDIRNIRKFTGLDTDVSPLNIANISAIYRYIVLARSFAISVQDLLLLLKLIPSRNAFDIATMEDTREIVNIAAQIKSSDFSFEQLRFLYQPLEGNDLVFQPRPEVIFQLAKTIGEGLGKLQDTDAKRNFVRLSWSNAVRLDEKTMKQLIAAFPAIETNTLALTADNIAGAVLTNFTQSYLRVNKLALFINGFKLKAEELEYFTSHAIDFGGFNLDDIPLVFQAEYVEKGFDQWLRLANYTALKKQFHLNDNSILKVFAASQVSFSATFSAIQQMTDWNNGIITDLMGNAFGEGVFGAVAEHYKNELMLLKFVEATKLSEKMGLSIKKLGEWATQRVDANQSMDIKNTLRAKYKDAEWNTIAKDVSNQLREKNRDALVAYMLAQPATQLLNINDSNDLYGYFLIDVEMQSCMMTSRIVQANASIQLFVQRCMMNLEPGVQPSQINEERWKWMKKYRVWEANRKVFLYPENWIEPELRDDKSPFFKELESALLQNEVNNENVEKALSTYLSQLDSVATLNTRAMYEDTDKQEIHVIGRTQHVPYTYFYRKYNTKNKFWTAWKKVEADIEGDHLCLVVWNRRLMMFWLNTTEKAHTQTRQQRITAESPTMYNENKLCWSEYRQNAWLPKKMSTATVNDDVTFIYPNITSINELEVICGNKNNRPDENGFWVWEFHTFNNGTNTSEIGFQWDEAGPFFFDNCHCECASSDMDVSKNTNTHDAYEELIYGLSLIVKTGTKKILDLIPGTRLYSITTREHIPRFKPGEYFFAGEQGRNYFVKTSAYFAPVVPELIKPIAPALPELEHYIPDRPWLDDPNLEEIIDWDSPIRFTAGSAGLINVSIPPDLSKNAAPVAIMMAESNAGAEIQAKGSDGFQIEVALANSYTYNKVALKEKYGFGPSVYLPMETGFEFFNFYHRFVCDYVKSLNTGGIDKLLTIANQKLGERNAAYQPIADDSTNFKTRYRPQSNVSTPYPHELVDFSENGAYSQYNWELFFHVPMLIANRLSKNQRFEEATRWFHFIFNPATTNYESSPKRYWNVLPFKITPIESIQKMFAKLLLPDGNAEKEAVKNQIEQWRDNPFNPHLIARMRLIAYMKNVVMKYLDNLIAHGDSLFRSETRESVNEAIQLYILAGDILGKKPTKISLRGKIKSENYSSLLPKLDAFQNAMVDMETFFPYYSESAVAHSNDSETAPLTNIVQVFYFCIPDNDKLLSYWDKVADRLYKIRNCKNIDGLSLRLSLFEPPIDPALLVQATAQGLDIGSVLADIGASTPLYRFQYMLQKAMEFANEVKGIGAEMLSAIEKKDAEEFSNLRAVQETAMLQMVKETKKLQYLEAVKNRENMLKSRDSAVIRWMHYKKLLGESDLQTPAPGEIVRGTIAPEDAGATTVDSRQVSSLEYQDLEKSAAASYHQDSAGIAEAFSGFMHFLPNWNVQPYGIGATFGGSNLGAAASTVASGYRIASNMSSVDAARAAKLGGFFRREQDWALQCNTAANEIMTIDKQILAAEIRIDIAAKERDNHDRQIENAQDIEAFLRSKYSNQDLYGWMQGEISTIFFQTYQMAFDLAKKAEIAYRNELGIATSNFIQYGYWESFKKGLLSGEKLALALRQLEKAYLETNAREYELTKHVSLVSLDPMALYQLRATGTCSFEIPEALFDMDNPGHFFRRIKSVSISLPCIAGPYTSVNATLSLERNRYRKNSDLLPNSPIYTETDANDDRFVYNTGHTQSIATSSGQNDSGVFELSFRDERYLPFEGTGAISNWNLNLPTGLRLFDYNTIADVILHVKYTAREGGISTFKDAVIASTKQRLNAIKQAIAEDGGMHAAFNLKHDFSREWHLLKTSRTVNLVLEKSRLPYFIQSLPGIFIENVQFVARIDTPGEISITVHTDDVSMTDQLGLKVGNCSGPQLGQPFDITIPDTVEISKLEELVMVVNYRFPD